MLKKNCRVFVFAHLLSSAAQQSQNPPQTTSVNKPAALAFLGQHRGQSAFLLKTVPIDFGELEARAKEMLPHAASSQQRAK